MTVIILHWDLFAVPNICFTMLHADVCFCMCVCVATDGTGPATLLLLRVDKNQTHKSPSPYTTIFVCRSTILRQANTCVCLCTCFTFECFIRALRHTLLLLCCLCTYCMFVRHLSTVFECAFVLAVFVSTMCVHVSLYKGQ